MVSSGSRETKREIKVQLPSEREREEKGALRLIKESDTLPGDADVGCEESHTNGNTNGKSEAYKISGDSKSFPKDFRLGR